MGLDVSVLNTAQCRILKDSGRFPVKIPRGLGLKPRMSMNISSLCDLEERPIHTNGWMPANISHYFYCKTWIDTKART